MKKETLKIFYHVFTDHRDEYFATEKESQKQFIDWKKEGHQNIRLWQEGEYYQDGKPTGDFQEIECLQSIGEWPV